MRPCLPLLVLPRALSLSLPALSESDPLRSAEAAAQRRSRRAAEIMVGKLVSERGIILVTLGPAVDGDGAEAAPR